jgi:carboxylesterase
MPLIPGAEPLTVDTDSDIGVLVLHGFTGSPKSMKPWARRLGEQGWRVRLPRLPGHGTTWRDMNITTWHDWYAEADRNLRELQRTCSSVFVMGLSMGGSLTLRLAEDHGAAISGIVLVNPAVHTERLDRFALPIVKHLVGSFPGISNDIAKPGQDEGAYDRIPLKAAASLQELWARIRDDIAKVDQPLLLFRSAVDHVVESSNADWIMRHVSSADRTEVTLHRSYHVATLDHDAEIIEQGSIDFVNRIIHP